MKPKNKKFLNLAILFLEIIILIDFPIIISDLLSKTNNVVSAQDDFRSRLNNFRQYNPFWWNVTYNNTRYFSASNSIANVTWACCPKTKNGAICQNLIPENSGICQVDVIPTSCDNFAPCQKGCCIDEQEGLCTTQAPKAECEAEGGTWKDDKNCLVSECEKGCCVLGGNVVFATEKRCKKLSGFYGFEEDFRDVNSEAYCLMLKQSQVQGACVLQGNACRFLTQTECINDGGVFYANYLCSNPELNTSCERQAYVGCAEGLDEVYWFDSCGNRENIYSSDRDISWNNGFVLEKNQSCNPDSSNADSKTCGNCNNILGSICSETQSGEGVNDGNYICKDLNCIDEKGHQRLNGESWCVYDSYIGDGKDPAGSRHWRRYCQDGKVITEPCADYRGQICTQTEIRGDTGKTFSIAQCSINNAFECLDYNKEDNMEELCQKNNDCMIKRVDIDSDFKFNVCVGKYPRGFDFTDADQDAAREICGLATQTCMVVYKKTASGHWKCIKNCDCRKREFSEKMNDFCISLGDCGSYINYVGDGTNNVKISKAPQISWTEYKSYANPVDGQFAQPRNISDVFEKMARAGDTQVNQYSTDTDISKALKIISTVSGAVGVLAIAASYTSAENPGGGEEGILRTIVGKTFGWVIGKTGIMDLLSPGLVEDLSILGEASFGFSIGMIAAGYIAQWAGLTGTGGMVFVIASSVAVATVFLAHSISGIWTSAFTAAPFAYVFWPAVIIAIYALVIGWGKIKIVKVKFTCMPWQPPIGGDNCHKCNEDPSKPCSKYRCDSLGTACRLLNENEENPVCEAIEDDGTPPEITPLYIQPGYGFFHASDNQVEIRKENQECIPEFTPVNFILKTNEYAQCRIAFEHTSKFEDMPEFTLEQNSFSENHTFIFSMPSLSSLEVYNVSGDIREMFGNTNLYMRCRDVNGNTNPQEYKINFCIHSGPDLTPPQILASNPQNNAIVPWGVNQVFARIYLNEPAECKYSYEDKSYNDMENSFNCETNLFEYVGLGWECNSTLNLPYNDTKIYIKCRDQPWLGPDNGTRNINAESSVYEIFKTQNPLNITSISPQGEVKYGFEPVSIELSAETSGGANNGESVCYYRFSDNNSWTEFFDNSGSSHTQLFDMMTHGSYRVSVKCEDNAGNQDTKTTHFNIMIDDSPPIVTRVYNENGELVLLTNEEAECYYSNERCNFNLEEGVSMTTALSTKHSTEWDTAKTYYIKCRDAWENTNPTCAIIVRPDNY